MDDSDQASLEAYRRQWQLAHDQTAFRPQLEQPAPLFSSFNVTNLEYQQHVAASLQQRRRLHDTARFEEITSRPPPLSHESSEDTISSLLSQVVNADVPRQHSTTDVFLAQPQSYSHDTFDFNEPVPWTVDGRLDAFAFPASAGLGDHVSDNDGGFAFAHPKYTHDNHEFRFPSAFTGTENPSVGMRTPASTPAAMSYSQQFYQTHTSIADAARDHSGHWLGQPILQQSAQQGYDHEALRHSSDVTNAELPAKSFLTITALPVQDEEVDSTTTPVQGAPKHDKDYHVEAVIPTSSVSIRPREHAVRRLTMREAQAAKPKRRGPLDSKTRDKVEEMRDMSACWRCRKYKKPCNGPGICDSCLIPKFKVWPSAIGCRRENLESMVRFLLPIQLEAGLAMLPRHLYKMRTWRLLSPHYIQAVNLGPNADLWAISKQELYATRYFDNDYGELADLAAKYQASLPKPHKCLTIAGELLLATCNWYKCIVDVPNASQPTMSLIDCGTAVRTLTRKAFTVLQQTCLSTKRTEWFPAFLSALLITCGAVFYMDTVMLMPAAAREHIWPDIASTRNDLRNKTYMLLIDLLRASTKGINPLLMDCWAAPHTGTTNKKADRIREKEREILLGHDTAALEGLLALKAWRARNERHLNEGKVMFTQDLVQQAQIKPIAGVWKVFEM